MLRILNQLRKIGVVTEPLRPREHPSLEELGRRLEQEIGNRFGGSLAIRHVDAGSCNGCELEIHALNNAIYDLERFGVHFVASPRHADMLLVTGPVSRHMEAALRRTYESVPEPKLVIAAGDCGADGGEFGVSYASRGGVANVIPVDGVIRGCPPSPWDLMAGILEAIRRKPATNLRQTGAADRDTL